MRLLDADGKQIGVVSKEEALKKAQEQELDLVEIAPDAKPPVVKIIDFKKFQYLEERKQKEARKHTKETELKEVRVSPFIGEHDLDVSLKRVKNFLEDGDMVKLSVVFKGRQMTHTEFGPKLLERVMGLLEGIGEKDRDPRWEGRRFVCILKPTKEAIARAQQEKREKEAKENRKEKEQTEESQAESTKEENETEN